MDVDAIFEIAATHLVLKYIPFFHTQNQTGDFHPHPNIRQSNTDNAHAHKRERSVRCQCMRDREDISLTDKTINPRALQEMKCLQAFFNKEASDYIRDSLGRTNATETDGDDDVTSAANSTATNHRSGREINDEASQQRTADGYLAGDQDLASMAIR